MYISEVDCKCRQVKYAKAEPGLLSIRSLVQACTRGSYKWSFSGLTQIPQNLHTSHIPEICNKNYVYTNIYRTLFIFIGFRFLKRENMRIQQILTLRLLVSLIRILQNRKISIQMDPDTKQTLLLSRFYTDLIRQKN